MIIRCFVFKFPKFCKTLHSCSSIADSESSYLHKHISSFLSSSILDSTTLLSTHAYIITTGHSHNKFIASKLIASYASLNQPHSSTKVFDSLSFRDPFLWNSTIKAHFSNGNYEQAIDFFSKMRLFGTLPNQFTLPMVVSACAELGLLLIGMNIHGLISKVNLLNENPAVGSSFVYMYSKCGALEYASIVFDEITVKDVVAWTVLVIGYVQNGESEKGLKCLWEMHRIGRHDERPNFRTLEGGFQACGDLSALVEGKCLHGLALKSGIVSSHVIQSAILSMYSKCGNIEDTPTAFCEVVSKDLFSWTSIIGVYARSGYIDKCFEMFLRMQANGVYPDGMVISCLISSFDNSTNVSEAKAFHGFIVRNFGVDPMVYSSLLSMYCKFGRLDLAEKIFNGGDIEDKDSWNMMVAGYGKAGLDINCMKLFTDMQLRGIKYDINTLISVISSCFKLGAIQIGRSIHCHTMKMLLFENASVTNSLINMYGKCGKLTIAEKLFHQTSQENITTWNSLISCYTHSNNVVKALTLFDEMVSKGLKPNTATLVTLLSACSHIASLEKGIKIHDYIRQVGYTCDVSLATALVDMYAKCGQIDIAKEIFDSISDKDVISWNVMISCYAMHGQGQSAIETFQQMEQYKEAMPNGLTFLAVLSACVHAGLVGEGKSLFEKMKEYSIRPTLKHYTCMVDLLGRSGCLNEAEAFILSMPFPPDGGLWGSLLTACKMHNNAVMGIKIAKCAIEADPENDGYYIVISDLYSSLGMWKEVEQVRNMMKDRGVQKTVGWSTT